jgi:hypothetical protein
LTAPCANPEGEYPCSRTPPFAHPSAPRRSAKCRNRRTNRLSLSITHLPSDADHGGRHAVSAKQRDFWRERTCGVCLSCPKRHVPTYKFLAMAVGRSWDLSTRRNFRLGVRREHTLSAEAITDAKVVVVSSAAPSRRWLGATGDLLGRPFGCRSMCGIAANLTPALAFSVSAKKVSAVGSRPGRR